MKTCANTNELLLTEVLNRNELNVGRVRTRALLHAFSAREKDAFRRLISTLALVIVELTFIKVNRKTLALLNIVMVVVRYKRSFRIAPHNSNL